jgi:hypothetical protein
MTDGRLTNPSRQSNPHEENGVMAFNNTINPHWHLSV